MAHYQAKKIEGLSVKHSSTTKDDYSSFMNEASLQLEECMDNLGSFADIKSIEHFETYSAFAENMHIKFTVEEHETPGDGLLADDSSTNIDDYDYSELTKQTFPEDE